MVLSLSYLVSVFRLLNGFCLQVLLFKLAGALALITSSAPYASEALEGIRMAGGRRERLVKEWQRHWVKMRSAMARIKPPVAVPCVRTAFAAAFIDGGSIEETPKPVQQGEEFHLEQLLASQASRPVPTHAEFVFEEGVVPGHSKTDLAWIMNEGLSESCPARTEPLR